MRVLLSLLFFLIIYSAQAEDDFNVEEAVELCSGCHGENGVPIELDYPVISGQQFFYIYTQLKDYAAGRRQNEIMTDIAAQYSRSQLKKIAQFVAEKSWPTLVAKTEMGDAGLAQKAIVGGQCSACHGKWQGDSRIPRLSGQQIGYIAKTMREFKNDIRMNAPDKNSTMKRLDEETIDALARYLAAL